MRPSPHNTSYLIFFNMWESISAEKCSTTINIVNTPTKHLHMMRVGWFKNSKSPKYKHTLSRTNLSCFSFKQSLVTVFIQLRSKEFFKMITLNLKRKHTAITHLLYRYFLLSTIIIAEINVIRVFKHIKHLIDERIFL